MARNLCNFYNLMGTSRWFTIFCASLSSMDRLWENKRGGIIDLWLILLVFMVVASWVHDTWRFFEAWRSRRGEGVSGSRGSLRRTFKRYTNPEVREETFWIVYGMSFPWTFSFRFAKQFLYVCEYTLLKGSEASEKWHSPMVLNVKCKKRSERTV